MGASIEKIISEFERQLEDKIAEAITAREKYHSLINAIDGIVWEADPETFQFTFVSQQAERMLGYPCSAWEEKGFWESHLHPDDRAFAVDFCVRQTRSRRPHEFEYRMIAADGRIVWLRDIVSLEVEQEKLTRLKGIMIDITRSKEAEAVLRESEERYRVLVENAPEALVVFDLEQKRFVSVSESATKLFRMSREDLMQVGPLDLSPEFQPDGTPSAVHAQRIVQEAINWQKPIFEWIHQDAEGNEFPCEVWLVRLPSPDKILIRGSIIDITERKKAEANLRESEAKFRAFFESSLDGILLTAPDGSVLMANPAACQIFGMSEQQICARGRNGLVDPADSKLFPWLQERRRHGQVKGELKLLRGDGSFFPAEVSSSIFTDARGEERTSIIIRDITERKKFEKQLQDSYREIRELTEYLQNIREYERRHIAREIHDELGQQLTALKMDVSWLANKIISEDHQVRAKLENLANMLDNTVKTVRRISSELRPSLLDDLGLVAAMDWHLHEFERKFGIRTAFREPKQDIQLSENVKTGLFRIFQESLTNVARHAEAKRVNVTLKENKGELCLTIRDDGRGFDAETQNHKTLGLLGMKERTSMIGGNYRIKSHIGKGTLVEVTVPLEKQPESTYL